MKIIAVSQINDYLKRCMDADPVLQMLCIRGEISNYKRYPSGHHYFTLKDSGGALRCVMFRGNAQTLRFVPADGQKVLATGRITVFPRDGAYQLYCTGLLPEGSGDLHLAFEQLKEKLRAEGLFDTAHKKPLPAYPKTIAIITSEAGAAVHDMLRILGARYPLCKVVLLPVRVQGVEAPPELCGAIRYVNQYKLADLMIVGRGGGSIEDLWAFNDERVARAIYASEIPVISAVGHEPDVTIADYVADLRAATPSNGAELAVPEQGQLRIQLSSMENALMNHMTKRLKLEKQRFDRLARAPVLRSPMAYVEDRRMLLSHLQKGIWSAMERTLLRSRQRFGSFAAGLDAMSPLKVLGRGYAMVWKEENQLVSHVKDLTVGMPVTLRLCDGEADCVVSGVQEDER